MARLKTHKGTKDRIKVTGTGKLLSFRIGRRHLMTGKSSRKTRRLRKVRVVHPVNETKLRRLLPYQ